MAIGKTFFDKADMEIGKLETDLRLAQQQFPEVQQMFRTRNFGNVVIECWTGFGLSRVTITVKGGAGEEKKVCKGCMCGCHVSLGFITVTEPESCITHITDLRQTYDVVVCNRKNKYVELTGCQPMDFTKYVDREKVYVLWVPDPPTTYADNLKAGCIMEASTWARILSVVPINARFDERPCQ